MFVSTNIHVLRYWNIIKIMIFTIAICQKQNSSKQVFVKIRVCYNLNLWVTFHIASKRSVWVLVRIVSWATKKKSTILTEPRCEKTFHIIHVLVSGGSDQLAHSLDIDGSYHLVWSSLNMIGESR